MQTYMAASRKMNEGGTRLKVVRPVEKKVRGQMNHL